MTTAGILASAPSRRAFAASVVEATTALADASAAGYVAYDMLVDDPASAVDHLDALVGELMVEAATASDAFTASSVHNAAVIEEATGASTTSATGTFTYNVSIAETVTAADVLDAFVSVIYSVSVDESATAADTPSTFFTDTRRVDETLIAIDVLDTGGSTYTIAVTEAAAASDFAQDATGVSPLVQTTWVVSAARAGSGSLAYSDDMSVKAQVIAGVGVVSSAPSSDVLAGTVTEATSASDAPNAGDKLAGTVTESTSASDTTNAGVNEFLPQ
jgi:hypothetical protein